MPLMYKQFYVGSTSSFIFLKKTTPIDLQYGFVSLELTPKIVYRVAHLNIPPSHSLNQFQHRR